MSQNVGITYKNLPKSVYVIFFTRVINSMGNFVFPFMTLLLTTKIGMSEEKVGFFLLVASIVQLPGSLLGGKLSDFIGRKKIMITFMALVAICYIPCAFLLDSPDYVVFIPWILILASFFNSIFGPANSAMLNDLTNPDNRQEAFSFLYLGMNVGTAVGSIVAGFLFHNYMEFLFIGDAITTLFAILLLQLFIKETKPNQEEFEDISEERADEQVEKGSLLTALLKRPRLLIFALIDSIFSFVYAQTRFSMPLQAKAIFGVNLGAKYFGTFNMINCIEVILLTTLITVVTRKIKAVYNVSIGGVFFAVGFGMLFFTNNFWLFVLSTLIWTVGEIINATNIGVYIANHTPISHRGRFSSIIDIISNTGGAISAYVMGGFITNHGVTYVWPVIFLLALMASTAMLVLGITEKTSVKARESAYESLVVNKE